MLKNELSLAQAAGPRVRAFTNCVSLPLQTPCRRIANRESARRVRQKRNEYMEDLQAKCTVCGLLLCCAALR